MSTVGDIKKTYGEHLDMKQIEQVTKDLFEKEQELKEIYKLKVKR